MEVASQFLASPGHNFTTILMGAGIWLICCALPQASSATAVTLPRDPIENLQSAPPSVACASPSFGVSSPEISACAPARFLRVRTRDLCTFAHGHPRLPPVCAQDCSASPCGKGLFITIAPELAHVLPQDFCVCAPEIFACAPPKVRQILRQICRQIWCQILRHIS